MNAVFNETVHCFATEPDTMFLRVSLADRNKEVAFDTAVLGRLRHGYRVLQLRSLLGTRIDLGYMLVRISFSSEPNVQLTPRQVFICNAPCFFEEDRMPRLPHSLCAPSVQLRSMRMVPSNFKQKLDRRNSENELLKQEVEDLRRKSRQLSIASEPKISINDLTYPSSDTLSESPATSNSGTLFHVLDAVAASQPIAQHSASSSRRTELLEESSCR